MANYKEGSYTNYAAATRTRDGGSTKPYNKVHLSTFGEKKKFKFMVLRDNWIIFIFLAKSPFTKSI